MARKRKRFNPAKFLNKVKGPLVEIGGPTLGGYQMIDFTKLNKKLLVSNLFPGVPEFIGSWDGKSTARIIFHGRVDFIADAFKLPMGDNTVGAVFASYFGGLNCKATALQLRKKKSKSASRKKVISVPPVKSKPKKKIDCTKIRIAMRKKAIKEAWRVLEPGGLLIWQGGDEYDFRFAGQNGFEVLFHGASQDYASAHYKNEFFFQVFKKVAPANS